MHPPVPLLAVTPLPRSIHPLRPNQKQKQSMSTTLITCSPMLKQHTAVVVLPRATSAFGQGSSPRFTTDAASRSHVKKQDQVPYSTHSAMHGIHNLCASPPELFRRKYQERLAVMRREDPPSITSIIANDRSPVKALRGIGLATAWQILGAAITHVLWWNGTHGRLQPSAGQPEPPPRTWASQL
jgi:hypothetical protein